MTLEMRIKIFLTKYRELVKELGLSISGNYCDDTSPLILRINPELKQEYGNTEEGCPSYLNFFGDNPEDCSFFVILFGDNGKMTQLDPFEELPTYDTGYTKLSQDDLNEQLKALGLIQ